MPFPTLHQSATCTKTTRRLLLLIFLGFSSIIMSLTFDTTPPDTNDFVFRGSDHLLVVPAGSPLHKCDFLPLVVHDYPLGNDTFGLPLRVVESLFEHLFKPTEDVTEQEILCNFVSPARFSRIIADLSEDGVDFSEHADSSALAAAISKVAATWDVNDHRRILALADLEPAQDLALAPIPDTMESRYSSLKYGDLVNRVGILGPVKYMRGACNHVIADDRYADDCGVHKFFDAVYAIASGVLPEFAGIEDDDFVGRSAAASALLRAVDVPDVLYVWENIFSSPLAAAREVSMLSMLTHGSTDERRSIFARRFHLVRQDLPNIDAIIGDANVSGPLDMIETLATRIGARTSTVTNYPSFVQLDRELSKYSGLYESRTEPADIGDRLELVVDKHDESVRRKTSIEGKSSDKDASDGSFAPAHNASLEALMRTPAWTAVDRLIMQEAAKGASTNYTQIIAYVFNTEDDVVRKTLTQFLRRKLSAEGKIYETLASARPEFRRYLSVVLTTPGGDTLAARPDKGTESFMLSEPQYQLILKGSWAEFNPLLVRSDIKTSQVGCGEIIPKESEKFATYENITRCAFVWSRLSAGLGYRISTQDRCGIADLFEEVCAYIQAASSHLYASHLKNADQMLRDALNAAGGRWTLSLHSPPGTAAPVPFLRSNDQALIFLNDCKMNAENFISINKSYGSGFLKSIMTSAGNGTAAAGGGAASGDKKRTAGGVAKGAHGGNGSTRAGGNGTRATPPSAGPQAQSDKQPKLGLGGAAGYMKVSDGKLAFGAQGRPFNSNDCAQYLNKHVSGFTNTQSSDICGSCLSTKASRSERNGFCHLSESDPTNHGENGKFHCLSPAVREKLQDFR